MKKQYIVSKYVMAESVMEALNKSKGVPITEIYVHNSWLEKQKEFAMFEVKPKAMGYKHGDKK
jgi:hypothetical protein